MEVPTPVPPLSPAEAALVSQFSDEQIAAIDAAILSQATPDFCKVAMIIGRAMATVPEVPVGYYAQRVEKLVADGRLVGAGDLAFLRFSEVRLAGSQ